MDVRCSAAELYSSLWRPNGQWLVSVRAPSFAHSPLQIYVCSCLYLRESRQSRDQSVIVQLPLHHVGQWRGQGTRWHLGKSRQCHGRISSQFRKSQECAKLSFGQIASGWVLSERTFAFANTHAPWLWTEPLDFFFLQHVVVVVVVIGQGGGQVWHWSSLAPNYRKTIVFCSVFCKKTQAFPRQETFGRLAPNHGGGRWGR